MDCLYCQSPVPPSRRRYCSKPCMTRHYQDRNRSRINAVSRAWCRRNPKARKRSYTKYQQENAKVIYQRNKWRQAEWYSRTASRRILLKLRPLACEARGKHSGRVECHHRDGDPFNREPENLQWLCKRHHTEAHPKTAAGDRGSSRHPAPSSDRP